MDTYSGPRPVRYPPGKDLPVPIWAPKQVRSLWRREISLSLPGNRTLTVQPVACRYTDWAIPENRLNISAPLQTFSRTVKQFHGSSLTGFKYILLACPCRRHCTEIWRIIPAFRGSSLHLLSPGCWTHKSFLWPSEQISLPWLLWKYKNCVPCDTSYGLSEPVLHMVSLVNTITYTSWPPYPSSVAP
jgi:hypothetical protein